MTRRCADFAEAILLQQGGQGLWGQQPSLCGPRRGKPFRAPVFWRFFWGALSAVLMLFRDVLGDCFRDCWWLLIMFSRFSNGFLCFAAILWCFIDVFLGSFSFWCLFGNQKVMFGLSRVNPRFKDWLSTSVKSLVLDCILRTSCSRQPVCFLSLLELKGWKSGVDSFWCFRRAHQEQAWSGSICRSGRVPWARWGWWSHM